MLASQASNRSKSNGQTPRYKSKAERDLRLVPGAIRRGFFYLEIRVTTAKKEKDRMGRKVNWPPKITKHKATGQSRVQFRGKTYYLGKHGSPEAGSAYLELLNRLAGSGKPVTLQLPGKHTIATLAAAWHVHALEEYGPDSQEIIEYRLALRPVLERYASKPVEEFDATALKEVQKAMAETLCKNVVNRRVIRIRTVWRWAEEAKIAPVGSWAGLRVVRPLIRPRPWVRETAKVQPVSWEQVEATARHVAPGLRLLILLGWHTGARPMELANLRAGQIDRRGDIWTARLAQHKCAWRGQSRTIYFGPEAQALLAPRLDAIEDKAIVAPNTRGYAFDRRTLYRAIRRGAVRAGVALWHPYQWRHAFRLRVTRTAGLDAARAALGHVSISTTNEYASGADSQLAEEAAKKVG
jgi:integrase